MQPADKISRPTTADTFRSQAAAERSSPATGAQTSAELSMGAVAEHDLLQLMARGSRMATQRMQMDRIHDSPRTRLQRTQLQGIFGEATPTQLRLGDEPLPVESASGVARGVAQLGRDKRKRQKKGAKRKASKKNVGPIAPGKRMEHVAARSSR